MDARTLWHGDELDLDGYLARVGFDGPRTPSLATLRALQRAHVTTIPFENLELMAGRPIPLDLESLQRKMVRQRRGGYCYENALLFAAALERLGFDVTGLQGRVTMGAQDIRPRTHALLWVTTADDDRAWLCDVGFGSGPLYPIELVASDREIAQEQWRYRLQRTGEMWELHQLCRLGWVHRHVFTLERQYPVDYRVGNHYVSTHPRSPFLARPYIQRFHADVHHILDDLTWTVERPDGSSTAQTVEPHELPKLLADVFDIEVDASDAAVLAAADWPQRRTP
ncbi:MAG: arylamine N-acetyltransferase [Mycobacteriaceae bacterium]|nr:arylamine N-acetyltransferase [Mycobacteriaceae bacterium]